MERGDAAGTNNADSSGKQPGTRLFRSTRWEGADRALERAMGASEARMAKRSGHAVSRGHDGRGERPTRGHGQPRWEKLTARTTLRRPANSPAPACSDLTLRGGADRALERAMGASEARMAKRSGHAVSRGHDGRGERPTRGHGRPRREDANRAHNTASSGEQPCARLLRPTFDETPRQVKKTRAAVPPRSAARSAAVRKSQRSRTSTNDAS
jgi:hypothetical protein